MINNAIVLAGLLGSLFFPFLSPGQSAEPPPEGDTLWVTGDPYRLFGRKFSHGETGASTLVVVLHGDAPPPYENPVYQNLFAAKVAAANNNVIAVALLRPGYTDADGNRSEGDTGRKSGDNWNEQNTEAIAGAIRTLKQRYKARSVVVAGHSGGAAITANILGRYPALIDAALLVSCPCGLVSEWRKSMLALTGIPVFKGEVDALSPLEQVEGISSQTIIALMVGTRDKVTPVRFSRQYQQAASRRNGNVSLVRLEGQPHNTFLEPAVLSRLSAIIKEVQAAEK